MSSKSKYRTLRLKGGSRVALRSTHKLPEKEVVEAVRFALADLNVDGCCVHIKNQGNGTNWGRVYYGLPGIRSKDIPSWCRYLIVVKRASLVEIVSTTAHEGRHLEEWREGRYRINKKRRSTERIANREGARKVEAWKAYRLKKELGL